MAGTDEQVIDLDAQRVRSDSEDWAQDGAVPKTAPEHVESPLDTAGLLKRIFFEQVCIALRNILYPQQFCIYLRFRSHVSRA